MEGIYLVKNNYKNLYLRCFISIILSLISIFIDSTTKKFINIRYYLEKTITPFYILCNKMHVFFDNFISYLIFYKNIQLENQQLKIQLILQKSNFLKMNFIENENYILKNLMNLPVRTNEHKNIAQVLLSNTYKNYTHKIIIDKGNSNSNVYLGQPVISEKGVIGQIIMINKYTSIVLLTCHHLHALPVQILRNNLHCIAIGNGCKKNLTLEFFSEDNIDIKIGDIIVTSGVDGNFFKGYPVGIISNINFDNVNKPILVEVKKPISNFFNLRYVVLLSKEKNDF